MLNNFNSRLKNIIKESLDDMGWIRDIQQPSIIDFDFDFNGKEYWVDITNIDKGGKKKIVDYIKKTISIPQIFGDKLDSVVSGDYKGIIVHCGIGYNDFEPEEYGICFADSSYEEDYEKSKPYSDISKSIYIDGREVIEFINLTNDEEELDESLEWSDKDEPFDEKDKSFENDPSWKDDEDWELNPERSYWKQGDAGGSGGGDMNESDDFGWVKDIRPTLKDVFDENLIEVGDILTLYGTLEDENGLEEQQVDDFKVKIDITLNTETPKLVSTYFIPLQKKYWGFLGYDGTGHIRFTKKDGNLQFVDRISSKDLVEGSNDLDWIKDVKVDPLMASPDVFFRDDDEMYYTLGELGHDITNMEEFTMCELAINYGYRWSEEHEGWYHRDEVADFTKGNYPKGVRRGLDESDELQWIKDVPDTIPPIERRNKIDLKDFIIELVKDSDEHMEVLQMLLNLDLFTPSDTYKHETGNNGEGFTLEEYDDFGVTNWLEGDWLEEGNSVWSDEPSLGYGEINELLNQVNGHKWVLEDWHTNDYNLEYGTYQDRYIFKNNFDGSYFALDFDGNSYDGIGDNGGYLYQVFPKQITKLIYESNKKIMFEGDMGWIEDIEPHKNYEGHPQGIVLLHNHQEIDEFCDIIDNYNDETTEFSVPSCDDLHQGLEDRKGELEEMSAEYDEDYGEAMLSASFFVEKRYPNKLTIGYWPYDVSEDEMSINDWLDMEETFNKDYQIYKNINQLKTIFNNYKKPNL